MCAKLSFSTPALISVTPFSAHKTVRLTFQVLHPHPLCWKAATASSLCDATGMPQALWTLHTQSGIFCNKSITSLLFIACLLFVLSSSCPLSKHQLVPFRGCWSSIFTVNKSANLSTLSLLDGGPTPVVSLSLNIS